MGNEVEVVSVDKSFEKFCCEGETRWLEENMEEGRAFKMDDTRACVCVLTGMSQQRRGDWQCSGDILGQEGRKRENAELKWRHSP